LIALSTSICEIYGPFSSLPPRPQKNSKWTAVKSSVDLHFVMQVTNRLSYDTAWLSNREVVVVADEEEKNVCISRCCSFRRQKCVQEIN
jgi:hypothetical protein